MIYFANAFGVLICGKWHIWHIYASFIFSWYFSTDFRRINIKFDVCTDRRIGWKCSAIKILQHIINTIQINLFTRSRNRFLTHILSLLMVNNKSSVLVLANCIINVCNWNCCSKEFEIPPATISPSVIWLPYDRTMRIDSFTWCLFVER